MPHVKVLIAKMEFSSVRGWLECLKVDCCTCVRRDLAETAVYACWAFLPSLNIHLIEITSSREPFLPVHW